MSAFEKELYEVNAKLCKAVGAHPVLYDRNNMHYKKKTATERCWESISEECNDSIPNCKRRWRQIREEYTRYFTDSPKRRKMSRNKPFYLQNVLKFLMPYMPNAGDLTEGVEELMSKESTTIEEHIGKETKKGKRKEHVTAADKSDTEMISNADECEQSTPAEVSVAAPEQREEAITKHDQQEELNEDAGQVGGQDEPTFYIKQSSNDPCTLTISKVTDPLETATTEAVPMAEDNDFNDKDVHDDDDVPLASSSRGRRSSKRSVDKQAAQLHGVKEIPVHRPEARMTRLRNARKSISSATSGTLMRDLVSPLPKMTPVPKAKQQVTPQLRQQSVAPATSPSINQPQSKGSSSQEQHGEVMAQLKHGQHVSPKKQTSNNSNVRSCQDSTKNSRGAKAKPSNNIDLTSTPAESHSQRYPLASLIAVMPQSTPKAINAASDQQQDLSMSIRVVPAREDRGVQCGPSQDEFTDDDFLNIIRPQMREMNARQKMHFKKKVFQSIMEVFDDATDFPNAGEVQHFNINTPSGFENSTTQELRLMRELVALVTAAKRTAELQKPAVTHQRLGSSTGRQSPADAAVSTTSSKVATTVVHQTRDELGLPRSVIQRVFKMNDMNGETAGAGTDKRCIYRIVPKGGAGKQNTSTASPGRTVTETHGQRAGTFVIAPSSAGASAAKLLPDNSSGHANAHSDGNAISKAVSRSNVNIGFVDVRAGHLPAIGRPRIADVTQAQAGPIRTMARRYSVCGVTPAAGTSSLGSGGGGSAGGNGDFIKVIPRSSLGNMANGLLAGSTASSVANVNGVQISLKRRSPSVSNPYQLSAGRARYPQVVNPGNVSRLPGVQSTVVGSAGNAKDKTSSSAAVTATEFVTPPNPRKVNDANSAGVNPLMLAGELRKSTSPYKRHVAHVARNMTQKPSTSAAAAAAAVVASTATAPSSIAAVDKTADASLSRLFNDNAHMQVAGTIAADDFSSVRIKQEDDVLLGM